MKNISISKINVSFGLCSENYKRQTRIIELGHVNNHDISSTFRTISTKMQNFKIHWLWLRKHLKTNISCLHTVGQQLSRGWDKSHSVRWVPLLGWRQRFPISPSGSMICLLFATFLGQSKSQGQLRFGEWRNKLRLQMGVSQGTMQKDLPTGMGSVAVVTTHHHHLWNARFSSEAGLWIRRFGDGREILNSVSPLRLPEERLSSHMHTGRGHLRFRMYSQVPEAGEEPRPGLRATETQIT